MIRCHYCNGIITTISYDVTSRDLTTWNIHDDATMIIMNDRNSDNDRINWYRINEICDMRDGILRINVLMDTFLHISVMAKSTRLCIKGFLWCFDVGRMLIYHGDNEAFARNERILVINHHPCQIFMWNNGTRDAIYVCINSLSQISQQDDINIVVSRIIIAPITGLAIIYFVRRDVLKCAARVNAEIHLYLSVQPHDLFIARNVQWCFMESRIPHHHTSVAINNIRAFSALSDVIKILSLIGQSVFALHATEFPNVINI